MVTIDQVESGIAAYLDKELMPVLTDGSSSIQKVIIGTGIALALRKSKGQIALLQDNQFVKMTGIFDEQGNVDLDAVKEELSKQIPNEGFAVELPVIGKLTFHKDDVDKLYGYISNTPTLK